MQESTSPFEAAIQGRKEFEQTTETIFNSPALEKRVTIEVVSEFAAGHDHIKISKSESDGLHISQTPDNLNVSLPDSPTVNDLNTVINYLLAEDFSKMGEGLPTYQDLLGKKYETLARLTYQIGKKHNVPTEVYQQMCTGLLKLSRKLEGKEPLPDAEIESNLLEEQADPDKEFFVWYFLGGRDSSEYDRLYMRFWSTRVNMSKNNGSRENLEAELKQLEQQENGEKTEEYLQKRRQLKELVLGPTSDDFEKYLMSKKGFLEKVTLDYIGGSQTTKGVTESIKTAVTLDFKQAVWARGMTTIVERIKPESDKLAILQGTRDLLKRFSSGRDNRLSSLTQGFIDNIPPIIDRLDIKEKFSELQQYRDQQQTGEITQEELVRQEEEWLKSLHDVFKMPYDKENTVLVRTPNDAVDADKLKYREAEKLVCRYQAEVHGFVLMRGFKTFSVSFGNHAAVLVEKSDGSYTLFDNSGWNLRNIDTQVIEPYSISKGLIENTSVDIKDPLKPEANHPAQIVHYFPERFFDEVDSPLINESLYNTRFAKSRGTYKGNELENLGISTMALYRKDMPKLGIETYANWVKESGGADLSDYEKSLIIDEYKLPT
ncbi:hypothetical protein KBA63_01985 [Candidatus Woesebacteria bacterium]|nr:hypothetical protein [Candidatus Woesebacteria bacterium]MBP9687375.1 hypothetical protein [Candidatus Woesebacteria bacterium]